MKRRLFLALLLTAASLGLSACATTDEDRPRESSIPWNRPQSWEGGGGIPGFSGSQ